MCLLVNQPADTKFDDAFLKGVYEKNLDGIGVMYAKDELLYHVKMVPNTFEDFKGFYKEHIEGRDCAWHARMRTHGDIDLDNCHPYWVLTEEDGYPIMLMHNGVLSTGNAKDKAKSDTWHFINDYLRPMLNGNPAFFTTPAFAAMVSSFIGYNNKFTMLDCFGNMVTLNKTSGTEHQGAWLSNTYAWDAPKPKWQPQAHHYPKHKGTSVKRAPITTPSTSSFKSMYKADRRDVMTILGDIKAFDKALYDKTTFLDVEKLVESLGVWNTVDFIGMAERGQLTSKQLAEGLKDPVRAEQLIDEIDMQRSFNFGGITL